MWDQFTHQRTWMAAHCALLRHTVPFPFRAPVLMTKLLQHISTVLGVLVLAVWFVVWYRKTTPVPLASVRPMTPFRKVTVVFTMAVIALLAGYPLADLPPRPTTNPRSNPLFFIVTVFEAITLVFCVQVLIYGVARTFGGQSRRA